MVKSSKSVLSNFIFVFSFPRGFRSFKESQYLSFLYLLLDSLSNGTNSSEFFIIES